MQIWNSLNQNVSLSHIFSFALAYKLTIFFAYKLTLSMKNTVVTSFVFLKQTTSPPSKQKQKTKTKTKIKTKKNLFCMLLKEKNLYATTNYLELKTFVCLQLLVKLAQSDL